MGELVGGSPVAQYLRMSTEHQRYSLEFQAMAIATYAAARNYRVVESYTDAGISGLRLSGRLGLQRLLADVVAGQTRFGTILVYDVSRWGRFQDPDQAAHYEFVCKEAGVKVEYCAEPFVNEAGLAGALVKQLKRAMAAEFSRELSIRISKTKRALAAQGYWMSGNPGYGLRRQLLTPDGEPWMVLEPTQRKMLHGGRVVVTHGPSEEVETVRTIFRRFVVDGLSCAAIARQLNAEGVPCPTAPAWGPARIGGMLRNEIYAGVIRTGKSSHHLGEVRRARSRDWIRRKDGCLAIVPRWLFDTAQRQFRNVRQMVSDETLLDDLRRLLKQKGRLSAPLIDATPGLSSADVYIRRFGGLIEAYERIGYPPSPRQLKAADRVRRVRPSQYMTRFRPLDEAEMIVRLKALLIARGKLTVDIINAGPCPNAREYRERFGGLRKAYALAGYIPSPEQERLMDAKGGQSISADEARQLSEAQARASDALP